MKVIDEKGVIWDAVVGMFSVLLSRYIGFGITMKCVSIMRFENEYKPLKLNTDKH